MAKAKKKALRKVKSGIRGLDSMLDGGIPSESVVLVSGCAGTGKTLLSLQFLAEGCMKYGERALYVSFEEREEKIRDQARQFGWDFAKLEKQGKLRIVSLSELSIGRIFSKISKEMDSFKPKRMVVDSITYMVLAAHARNRVVDLEKTPCDEMIYGSSMGMTAPLEWDGLVVRKVMIDLVKLLEARDICTLLTSEVSKESPWFSRDTLSEFACDGIISLKATSVGDEMHRTLEVVKMRNTRIKGGIHSFDFSKGGIEIES